MRFRDEPSRPQGCPKCGCRHAAAVQADDWMTGTDYPHADAAVSQLRTCRHCGTQYSVAPDDDSDPASTVVKYARTYCPRCSSPDTPVQRTDLPIRYHKCRNCDLNFKSCEG